MPKISFLPKVLVKRNKFSTCTRNRVVRKRKKFISLDERNEITWRHLKNQLGYRTDSSFLEYLLELAQQELQFSRPAPTPQRHVSNENESASRSLDSRNDSEKQSHPNPLFKIKPRKSSNPLENAKKGELPPEAGDGGETEIQTSSQFEVATHAEEGNPGDETDAVTENSGNAFLPGYENNSSWPPPEEAESEKSSDTEDAKDFYFDSVTFNDRNRGHNLDELSSFKDLTLQNSSGHGFFSLYESSSAIACGSSHNSGNEFSIFNARGWSKNNAGSKTNLGRKEAGKRRVRSCAIRIIDKDKSRPRRNGPWARLNEPDNFTSEGEVGKASKSTAILKMCMKCRKRHPLGKCKESDCVLIQSEAVSSCSLPEQFHENYLGKIIPDQGSGYAESESESKNVYDFDDNEREINIDGSSRWSPKLLKTEDVEDDVPVVKDQTNSTELMGPRWSPKLLKTEDVEDDVVPVVKDQTNSTELMGPRWSPKLLKTEDVEDDVVPVAKDQTNSTELMGPPSVYAAPVNNEGSDSDSSDSELKLKIDESTGENLSFAESSLPDHLVLRTFDEEHGQSVFTKTPIPESTHLGPLIGVKVREMDIPDDFNMKFIWEVNSADGVTYLSTKDSESSNWLRFLRPASSRDSANLVCSVMDNQLYFTSTRDITEGEELVYWMDDTHSAWSKKKLEKKNCGGCNIQFAHPLYYRKHCMIFHDPSCSLTIRKYHCKICGLAVLGKEKIMKHAADMHQGKGAYQCQYCLKFFLRLNYLEMHRTYGCSKNPQRSRPLCDLCGRKFCQPQKLKVHIKRMHSDMAEVLKDFQCKSCLKILGSRAALQRHMKEVHSKDIIGACACDRCGKMFQNKSNLKIHMLTHSGVKPFKCQQMDCTAAFTTKQCLQFHYKKVHGFTDDFIPKIERSIAYTFDAYSGGTISGPSLCQSPKFEEYQSPLPEQKECCLDLSLVNSPEAIKGKEKVHTEITCQSETITTAEDPGANHRRPNKDEVYEKGLEHDDLKEEEISEKNFNQDADPDNNPNKIVINKGNKKWIVSETSNDKTDEKFKSLFRSENMNASLLVEAAITSAEKDIEDKPVEKLSAAGQENIIDTPAEIYSINQYAPGSPGVMYDTGEKKFEDYGKTSLDPQKSDSCQDGENKKCFLAAEKTNFNDFLKCSSLLKINTSPVNEIPKDYNISSIIRDQETETFTDIELQDYRNRDLLDTYRENDGFHDQYRAHDLYRNEKLDLYRSGGDSDLRMSSTVEKFEYRDFDVSNDAYRNLTSNLEKYRNADLYRLRNEGYDLGAGYRDLAGEERDGEAQNLCLKEKSFQYDTLEELARIGRDNPGFECLLGGESGGTAANQSFGTSAPRLHGMLSPRPYHPSYESESVDLSVPRPSYSSSPIYTLDLTPARVDIPSRHLDFRSHLALSPHRFSNSRLPGLSNGGSQLSPTGYGVYSSPYAASSARHSPTSQFQPYTSLYY